MELAYSGENSWRSPPPAQSSKHHVNTAKVHNKYWAAGGDEMYITENNPMDTSKIDYLKDDLEFNIKSAVRTAKKSINDVS